MTIGCTSEQHLTVPDARRVDYDEMIAKLVLARDQIEGMLKGEAQDFCAVCGDNGHTAEECHHNPLLLAVLGGEALLGNAYRCFHCGALFTDEASARNHFGDRPEIAVSCIRLEPTPARERIRFLVSRAISGTGPRHSLRPTLEAILDACCDEARA